MNILVCGQLLSRYRRFFLFLFLCMGLFTNLHAAIFNIIPVPGTVLPTDPGTKAYYQVTNTTSSTRSNIYVRYLPPNVTQEINSVNPGTCAARFVLAPNASCILELNVNGPVNASDPNPQHHLFVCLAGCIPCCAGTLFPLNVGTTPIPTVLSITIMPSIMTLPSGDTQQYTAIALRADGSTLDVTSSTVWSSSNPIVASISNTGLLTANTNGPFSITGTYTDGSGTFTDTGTGTVLSVVSLAVTPSTITLPSGATQQYTAIATLSDASTIDVTASTVWNTSNPAVASIDSTGLLMTNTNGNFTVIGTFTNISGAFQDTATGSVISVVSISVTPMTVNLSIGATQQYTATATLSDGSTIDVTASSAWSSSNPAIASINSATGFLTANSNGSFTVTASYTNISGNFVDNATGTVSVTLVSLSVTPDTITIPVGAMQQYTATALFSDSSTADVTSTTTWSSSNVPVASIDSTGLLLGNSPGTFIVTGTYSSASDSTSLSFVREQTLYATTTANDSIRQCQVNFNTGAIGGCADTSITPFNPEGIVLNPTATLAYITSSDVGSSLASQLRLCVIDPVTGAMGSCQNAGAPNTGFYQGLTMNMAGTVLYISNYSSPQALSCTIDQSTGLLSSCVNAVGSFSSSTGIVLNATGDYAYVSNFSGASVTRCVVNSLNGSLGSCINSGATGFTNPDGLGANGNYVYICNQSSLIKCVINPLTGMLSACVDSGAGAVFSNAQNVAFTSDGSRAYIPNRGSSTITSCSVDAITGSLSLCSSTAGFNSPTSVALK